MNILIGSSSAPDIGKGISTYCKEISQAFIENGHSIIYASPEPSSFAWINDYNIKHIPTPFNESMGETVTRLLKLFSTEDIHGIINNDNPAIQNIAPFSNVPFISVCHLDSTIIASLIGHNIQWVDYTVAISSDMQLNLMKRFGLLPHNCPLIYNGIKDTASIITTNNAKMKNIQVVYGGGMLHRKGGDIIKKLLENSKESDGIDFHIYGDIPARMPDSLKHSSYINFHGKVSREKYLNSVSNSDIFLMPSRAEGCPMALLEAMSCQLLPIVSNGIGAMRWIVTNLQNGFVCDINQWDKQALTLLRFLTKNKDVLARLKENARLTYLEKYTSKLTADNLELLLLNPVIDRSNKPTQSILIKNHRKPNSSFVERACYRLGILRKHSIYNLEQTNGS